ncbi:MAG: hypothetical protein ABR521_04820 [Gaiellaceae bacterium]
MTKYLMRAAIAGAAIGLLAPASAVGAPSATDRATGPNGVDIVYFNVALKKTKPRRSCVLRWRTGEESNLAGFHLYRVVKNKRTRITRAIVPAKAAAGGATYKFTDKLPKALKTAGYRLEAVGLDGVRLTLRTAGCGMRKPPV